MEYLSVERALVRVQMPRMSAEELYEIVDKDLSSIQFTRDEDARDHIAALSQGSSLPLQEPDGSAVRRDARDRKRALYGAAREKAEEGIPEGDSTGRA